MFLQLFVLSMTNNEGQAAITTNTELKDPFSNSRISSKVRLPVSCVLILHVDLLIFFS